MHRIHDDIFREKSGSVFVVNIHDTDLSNFFSDPVFIEIFEEEELGIDLVVHLLMQVEVILRDIGHDSDIVAKSVYTVVVERMARCLHDEVFTPRFSRTSDEIPYSEW